MNNHAHHFLSRLDRTSAAETEFALALYRDPELLRSIIELSRPDPSCERVAISLGDDDDGPVVIVTRDARFVTCLERGMQTYDAARVSRADLEHCGATVVRLREAMHRARETCRDQAASRTAFSSLYAAGDRLRREDIEVILGLQPLMLPHLVDSYSVHLRRVEATLRELCRRTRFRGDEHPRLRALWLGTWAAAHYMTLIASDSLALSYRYVGDPWPIGDLFTNIAAEGVRLGIVPSVLRGAWSAARMAPLCIDGLEGLARDEEMSVLRIGAVWALAATGIRHPTLTERVSQCLEALAATPSQYVSALAPVALQAMRERLDDGPAWERRAIATMRSGIFYDAIPGRWDAFDDDAVAVWHGTLELGIHDEHATALLALLVPWFATREASALCQPETVVRRVQERWSVHTTESLLQHYRALWLPPTPSSAVPTPGRNDPCTCGSGRKFKRCCG